MLMARVAPAEGVSASDAAASQYASRPSSKEPSILADAVLLGDVGNVVLQGSRRELGEADFPLPLKAFRSVDNDALDEVAHALWAAELDLEAKKSGKRRACAMLRALLIRCRL